MLIDLPFGFSLVSGCYGVLASLVAIIVAIKKQSLPKFDRRGIFVSILVIVFYFLMPLLAEDTSQVLVAVVLTFQLLWALNRTYIAGWENAVVSASVFGLISILSLVVAFAIGNWMCASWAYLD